MSFGTKAVFKQNFGITADGGAIYNEKIYIVNQPLYFAAEASFSANQAHSSNDDAVLTLQQSDLAITQRL